MWWLLAYHALLMFPLLLSVVFLDPNFPWMVEDDVLLFSSVCSSFCSRLVLVSVALVVLMSSGLPLHLTLAMGISGAMVKDAVETVPFKCLYPTVIYWKLL